MTVAVCLTISGFYACSHPPPQVISTFQEFKITFNVVVEVVLFFFNAFTLQYLVYMMTNLFSPSLAPVGSGAISR